jgi:hypothetical protein
MRPCWRSALLRLGEERQVLWRGAQVAEAISRAQAVQILRIWFRPLATFHRNHATGPLPISTNGPTAPNPQELPQQLGAALGNGVAKMMGSPQRTRFQTNGGHAGQDAIFTRTVRFMEAIGSPVIQYRLRVRKAVPG